MKSFLALILALSMLTACSQQKQPAPAPTPVSPQPAPAQQSATPTVPEDATLPVTLTMSEDFKIVTIAKGGKTVTTVSVENSPDAAPEVHIIKETPKSVYFNTCATGFGGYIFYRFCYGPGYRFDSTTNVVTKILSDGEIYDVSVNEDSFIWLPNGTKNANTLKVRNMATKLDKTIIVPKKYNQHGDAKFSPDGKKIAYAAIVGDAENEQGSVIMVDLATGKQTYIVKDNPEDIYAIFGWTDNNTVDYGAMGGD